MEREKTINLLSSTHTVSPQMAAFMEGISKVRFFALIIFFLSVVIVGGMYGGLQYRLRQLSATHDQLASSIQQNAEKEQVLAVLKQRIAVVSDALGAQEPVNKIFSTVQSTFPSSLFSTVRSIELDDKGQETVTVRAPLTDMLSVTDALVKQASVNTITSLKLTSFSLGTTGNVDAVWNYHQPL